MATMMQPNFIQPILGMIGVTAGVWGWMYVKRLGYLKRQNIDPQSINTPSKMSERLPESIHYPSDNFKNLFEMPVIFYVVCLCAELFRYQGIPLSSWLYQAAWGFVILRAIHSLIHCSYNKVMHRFSVYMLSCLVLWAMVIKLALLAWR
ncbi:MAG: MAPEG family protein [Psychrobacter sp.]|nr:MAPEG family protein [Psychrobacter sp.]